MSQDGTRRSKPWNFGPPRARARAKPVNPGHMGHLATKFDPTLLHFQKNLRRILEKLLISTLTWAIQFLDCFPHRRDMYQSRLGTPRAAPGLGKIPQIFAEIPGNPEVANLRASTFFLVRARGGYILKGEHKGFLDMYGSWGGRCPQKKYRAPKVGNFRIFGNFGENLGYFS